MNEEIKPVIVDGIEIPGYFVSNFGRVFTSLSKRRSNGKYVGSYVSEQKSEMKPSKEMNGRSGQLSGLRVELTFAPGTFGDYSYRKLDNKETRKIYVHQLVMQAFRPVLDYPPEVLKPYWDSTPNEVKKWIAKSVIINHMDHDPSNNFVDNLEYVTARENSRAAVKHYGGNLANRKTVTSGVELQEEKKVTILEFV